MRIKKLLCMIASVVLIMSCCTMAKGETVEERVNRVYPNWKEDWENWNNKDIVEEYDKALVCAVIEHESRYDGKVGSKYRGLMLNRMFDNERQPKSNIIDILL